MKKLVGALLLVPALSHAALVVLDDESPVGGAQATVAQGSMEQAVPSRKEQLIVKAPEKQAGQDAVKAALPQSTLATVPLTEAAGKSATGADGDPQGAPKPQAEALVVAPPVAIPAPPVAVPLWSINQNDKNVREALHRWARNSGWQLAWDISKDIEITGEAEYRGSFEEALTQLLQDLQGAEVALSACVYDNNMARIVRSTVECARRTN
ncbi:toxin co-regulated pilus biosynthesis Q family protein [Paracidovorax citrulli]